MPEYPPSDPRFLWKEQPFEPFRLSPEQARDHARRFQRKIRWRNLFEYLGAIWVIGVFGSYAVLASAVVARAGAILVVLGTLFVVYRLHTRGSSRTPPPDAVATSCLEFHRRELERQHTLVSTVWRWYLGPFLPGLFLLLAESAVRASDPAHLLKLGVFAAVCALIFLAVAKANQMAARQFEEELRALAAEPK
jgi:hypothetical protein